MKVGFIINSRVESKGKLESLFSSFEADNFSISYFETEYAGHAIDLAKKLKQDNFDWLISVGGDGTLNEIVNGLIESDQRDESTPSLAMFPVGTGNDFSLSIKTTKDPSELIQGIKNRSVKAIDIGKISTPEGEFRFFINVADAGMGGEVTRKISTSGNTIGKWVYYSAILQSFMTFKRPTLKIISPDNNFESKVISVIIGNGISFGGGYRVVFDAKLNDGQFFVAVIGDISILTYLSKLPQLMLGKRIEHPAVKYFHTKEIELINVSEHPCYLEMDGEPSYSCPVKIKCLSGMINFLDLI